MSELRQAATEEVLLTGIDHGLATLTLNRREKRNALSREMLQRLETALNALGNEPAARVVVVEARGSVFCSGHDLGEMLGCSEENYRELFTLCSRVMLHFRRLPQPVIAKVQGTATAAGCQLVAACDLAVAAETATFATPGVKIGLFCTTPMVPLVRAVPPKAAMEMLLTGKPIAAQRAYELGLINRVVPADRLDEAVREYVDCLLASSPLTLRLGKEAFYRQLALDEATAYDDASRVMTRNACCHDAQEGIDAFLGKRPPKWSGS